jgi:hypothetical protein
MKNISSQINCSGTPPITVQWMESGWLELTWTVAAGETFAATCRMTLPETAQPFW